MPRAPHLQRGESGVCVRVGQSDSVGRSCSAASLGAVLGRTLHQRLLLVRSLASQEVLHALLIDGLEYPANCSDPLKLSYLTSPCLLSSKLEMKAWWKFDRQMCARANLAKLEPPQLL